MYRVSAVWVQARRDACYAACVRHCTRCAKCDMLHSKRCALHCYNTPKHHLVCSRHRFYALLGPSERITTMRTISVENYQRPAAATLHKNVQYPYFGIYESQEGDFRVQLLCRFSVFGSLADFMTFASGNDWYQRNYALRPSCPQSQIVPRTCLECVRNVPGSTGAAGTALPWGAGLDPSGTAPP